jgi:hypothetical protein
MFYIVYSFNTRALFEKFDRNFNLRYQGIILEFSKN